VINGLLRFSIVAYFEK